MRSKFCALSLLCLVGCASAPTINGKTALPAMSLDLWVEKQRALSLALLQRNISPAEPKTPDAAKPLNGIVVAAMQKKDPDYYFHWVRDSALVMSALVTSEANRLDWLDQKFADFLKLNVILQKADLGEPRFTVDGQVDQAKWPRPQFDGPALRAFAITRYLDLRGGKLPKITRDLALSIIKTDLQFVAKIYRERGYDVWEEVKGDNYNVRLAQWTALRAGAKYFSSEKTEAAARELAKLLEGHRGGEYLRSQTQVVAMSGYPQKPTDLDSAVIVSVVDANLHDGANSVLDPLAQATVEKLSEVFKKNYPLNNHSPDGIGVGFGRYDGDKYFGGNPWTLITADIASFHFRLARRLLEGATLKVTPQNLNFVNNILPLSESLRMQDVTGGGMILNKSRRVFKTLVRALSERGDEVLRRLQMQVQTDGDFYEQFDKVSGQPVSARGLAWAHAAFLLASAERRALLARVDK